MYLASACSQCGRVRHEPVSGRKEWLTESDETREYPAKDHKAWES
jgi:hypothetical protein